MPDKMSREKIDLLRALGAEVVIAPTDVDPESPQSYYRVADRLTEEIPGAFQPNQYRNPANPQTHYDTTGPEIWRQTAGRITHLVAGVGTGGTITGVGRYLRSRTRTSRSSAPTPRDRSTPGRRCTRTWSRASARTSGRPPTTRASSTATSASPTATASSPRAGSPRPRGCSSAARAGSPSTPRSRSPRASTIRTRSSSSILPDGGRAYLSKIFNDTWMASHGMLERTSDRSVGDVLRAKQAAGEIPPLVVVESRQQVKDAVALLHEHRVSQLPVVSHTDPDTMVGSIGERGLLLHAADNPGIMGTPIVDVMEPPFPAVAAIDPVREAVELLSGDRQALLVTERGRPTGILTRADLLEALVS